MNQVFNIIISLLLIFSIIGNALADYTVYLPTTGEVVTTNSFEWANNAVANNWSASALFDHIYNAANAEGAGGVYTSNGVACANGVYASSGWGTPAAAGGSSAPAYDPGPPPPPPSCTYISSWSDTWSDCAINSEWNSNGSISCRQTVSWSPNYTTLGQDSCPANASQPSMTDDTKVINIDSVPVSECRNTIYANNTSTCKIRIHIAGAVNGGKSITGLSGKQVTSIENLTIEPTNRIDGGGSALNFSAVSNTSIQPNGATAFYFDVSNIKSRSPFINNNGQARFNIEGLGSSTSVTTSNIAYSFKKPFIGSLSIIGDTLKIGTEQTSKLSVTQQSNLSVHTISNFMNSLNAIDVNYVVQNKNSETDQTSDPQAHFTLNYKGNQQINTSGIQTIPHIDYILDGQIVKYLLTTTEDASDNSPIVLNNAEFLRVKIVGMLQGAGKLNTTGQSSNFSDISKFNQRTNIKKNTQKIIMNMVNGQVLNGVKYITGDIVISGDQDYETLIVKNGNITINGDLNPSGKLLGIIAIRDDQSRKDFGNIYIVPNVTKINAIIYGDGGLISTGYKSGEDTAINYKDSTTRTLGLSKQLIIKGSIFTRNTIGGAIAGSSTQYILPGGAITTDFHQAMMYDLNYIRRNYTGWDKNSNNTIDSGEYKNPLVIIYDSRIQSSPPKGFSEN